MYLNFINLNTGLVSRAERAHVSDGSLYVIAPWLKNATNGERTPLPGGFGDYDAIVYIEGGGLVVTVYHGSDPLVTFGVAQRARHGAGLWGLLLANFAHAEAINRPAEPWIAVAAHPHLMRSAGAAKWLADFEQCVAWAWITRNVQIEPMP